MAGIVATLAVSDVRSQTAHEALLKQAESRFRAIYDRDEFRAKRFQADWLPDSSGYTVLEYLVVSIDNRGTPAPKGAAWRRAIYGSLGPLSTEEQAAALKELARTRSYVDASRINFAEGLQGKLLIIHGTGENNTHLQIVEGLVDLAAVKAAKEKETGVDYRLMVEHVKKLLADLKRVVPDYI